jgi:hypothetical protein
MKKKLPEKKRVIVDYKNITQELLQLFSDTYPDGIDDKTIFFTNAKGERVEAVPLETADTKYLVKLSAQLAQKVEDFMDEIDVTPVVVDDDDDDDTSDDDDKEPADDADDEEDDEDDV